MEEHKKQMDEEADRYASFVRKEAEIKRRHQQEIDALGNIPEGSMITPSTPNGLVAPFDAFAITNQMNSMTEQLKNVIDAISKMQATPQTVHQPVQQPSLNPSIGDLTTVNLSSQNQQTPVSINSSGSVISQMTDTCMSTAGSTYHGKIKYNFVIYPVYKGPKGGLFYCSKNKNATDNKGKSCITSTKRYITRNEYYLKHVSLEPMTEDEKQIHDSVS